MPKNKNNISKGTCSSAVSQNSLNHRHPEIISPLLPSYTRLIFASNDVSTIGFFQDATSLESTKQLDLTTHFSGPCSLR